ncbi:MAG TPA: DUF1003 domain-containing protein [Acidiferrobacterales bacterium]|nr:DUF1003 domain-containing protein [Acidiferrobacterales bacterium]
MPRTLNKLINENLQTVVALENELYGKFSPLERWVHQFTLSVGRFRTAVLHLILFALWIALNSTMQKPWDPWPYNGLIIFLACESILLTLLVLATQRIMQKLHAHRTSLALQIGLLNEQETTKILEVLERIEKKSGVAVNDEDLSALSQQTSHAEMSSAIEKSINNNPEDHSPPS